MKVVINRNTMAVVAKFPNGVQLPAKLDAYPHAVVDMLAIVAPLPFTHLELKLLYRSLGSVINTNLAERESVEGAVIKLLDHIPCRDPDQQELLPTNPWAERAQAPVGNATPAANTSTPAKEPGMGSTKGLIWETADRMWNAAGLPTDPKEVLALRKQIMTQLEGLGVKRTTSSTSLGEWQKTRLT